jgi:hypothetical protein
MFNIILRSWDSTGVGNKAEMFSHTTGRVVSRPDESGDNRFIRLYGWRLFSDLKATIQFGLHVEFPPYH